MKKVVLGTKRTGERLTASVSCSLPVGTFSWRVVARDEAGNRGVGNWHYLVVYPGKHNHK